MIKNIHTPRRVLFVIYDKGVDSIWEYRGDAQERSKRKRVGNLGEGWWWPRLVRDWVDGDKLGEEIYIVYRDRDEDKYKEWYWGRDNFFDSIWGVLENALECAHKKNEAYPNHCGWRVSVRRVRQR